MKLSDAKVSFFKNVYDKQPKEVSLIDVTKNIQTNEKLKTFCSQLKELPKDGDTRTKFKEKHLPAITVSGTFKKGHAAACLVNHSNLIQVDFDKVDNLPEMAGRLKADLFTYVLFISPSGTGIKLFVQIDGSKHLECFKQLEAYYKNVYGLIMDKKCKDVGRPCFLSYDPDLFINENASAFSPPWPTPANKAVLQAVQTPGIIVKNSGNRSQFNPISLEEEINDVVVQIEARRTDITQGYENWIKAGFALANALGERGRDYFHRVSSISNQYNYEECDTQFTKCINGNNSGVTKNSFFGLAKEMGITVTKKAMPANTSKNIGMGHTGVITDKSAKKGPVNMVIQVEKFLLSHFEFRYNEVSNRAEVKKKGAIDWEELNERNISRFLWHNNYNIAVNKLTTILSSDFVPVFNPFKSYFDSVGKYDELNEPDYIQNLCKYINAKDQIRFSLHLKKHLVRTVACALDDNYYNKQAFVIIHDKQNSGKSTLCRWFCPPLLKKYLGENVNLSNKDGEIALTENFLINLDELAALNRQEINQLKSVMSRDRISLRRPFEKNTSQCPRRCSFFGSTNRTEFLNDETGSVRWLCFEIESINWEYKKDVDINKVWAQAYHMYKTGFEYNLTAAEIADNETANHDYFVSSPEEDLLAKFYRPGEENDKDAFLTSTDILNEILKNTGTAIRLNPVTMGKVLTKNGFNKISKRDGNDKPIKGYYVKFSNSQ